MTGIAKNLFDHLLPAERIMLAVTAALAAIGAPLIAVRSLAVDLPAYLFIFAVAAALIAVGLVYRISDRSQPFAAALIATGSYILFSAVAAAFNYVLLPVWRTPIDPTLAAIDLAVGFHWPTVMAKVAEWPWFVEITRYAYLSSLPQFAVIIIVLGLGNRIRQLEVFMLATVLCCLATVGFWSLFPSFGTSTLYLLPAELAQALNPVVANAYGNELLRLAVEGPHLVSPTKALGLIAAPSFHTVMALLAVFAMCRHRVLALPFVILNALVLPGTIIHGGHHLVDLIAGAVVAVLGVLAATRLLAEPAATRPPHRGSLPEAALQPA